MNAKKMEKMDKTKQQKGIPWTICEICLMLSLVVLLDNEKASPSSFHNFGGHMQLMCQ